MARFFINRPIVAIVISILTVVGGLIALLNLPVDERLNRMACTWLSQRDCCQLIQRCGTP